jgi:hypothetical protein
VDQAAHDDATVQQETKRITELLLGRLAVPGGAVVHRARGRPHYRDIVMLDLAPIRRQALAATATVLCSFSRSAR